jgi:general secretion pathway protein G
MDRRLVPINQDFDLYSMGRDGKTAAPLTASASLDDVVRGKSGGFIGLATGY